jgi:PAS domain S-box-containing protein
VSLSLALTDALADRLLAAGAEFVLTFDDLARIAYARAASDRWDTSAWTGMPFAALLDHLGDAPGALLQPQHARVHSVVARDSAGRRTELQLQVDPLANGAGALVVARRPDAVHASAVDAGLHAVLEGLPAAVCVLDGAGAVVVSNAAGRRLWGESPAHAALIEADEAHTLYDVYQRALTQQKSALSEQLEIIALDGSRRAVLVSALPYFDANGMLAGVVGTALDLTGMQQLRSERQALQAQLSNERERFGSVLRQVPAAVAITIGPEHRLEAANERCVGLAARPLPPGGTVAELFPDLVERGLHRLLDRAYASGRPIVRREVRLEHPLYGARNVDFVVQPLIDNRSTVFGLMLHAMDVTEQVQARRAIENASEAKSELVAHLSHELRTPLNAIIGYAQLLLTGGAGDVTGRGREYVERIERSARTLQRLIDDILAQSRLDAGHEPPNPEHVESAPLMEDVRNTIEPLASARGLGFEVDIERLPPTLYIDRRKVLQIVLNLLSNAVRYTDEGFVRLEMAVEGGELHVVVRDTGIGMDAAAQTRLFEPFWQADRNRREGTGLGLTITKQLVEALDGTIAVVSEPGVGTTFRVLVPARQRVLD